MLTDKVAHHDMPYVISVMKEVVQKVLDAYNETPEGIKSPKSGVYVSIYTIDGAIAKVPRITLVFGDLSEEKGLIYRHHCQEKACRLGEHIADGHMLSFESADIPADLWPGAVLINNYIFSCSGLPWKYDEVVGFTSASKLELTTTEHLTALATLSNNEVYTRLAA